MNHSETTAFKVQLKTKEERDVYIKPATEFVRTRCYGVYDGVSAIAITAIAEYLAYQDGYTIRNWDRTW